MPIQEETGKKKKNNFPEILNTCMMIRKQMNNTNCFNTVKNILNEIFEARLCLKDIKDKHETERYRNDIIEFGEIEKRSFKNTEDK